MLNPIQSLSMPLAPLSTAPAGLEGVQEKTAFKDYLLDSLKQVNDMQQQADAAVEKLVTGGDVTPAEVLTAVQKADIAFKLMIQVRNKLVQAYDEVQAMRV